ncbi:hypothetical protein TcarDRAFT_0431 [Thermosinus carboxydivorans Nor1]|uniref:Uncharacterized protein n=1 Tax=Thermosinus carboxydivorans Nor1 TaxID=401526 RepID=A1HT88_9FIRM|nr:hypothetical protein [Thermosinus carboxydivorans]EAX46766.1 hypothetical protein TcarDRAFT_0431 [Thermosinus carboxydivorans Nor1]
MWIVIPALSLALVHIAGDNVAVVPDMAGNLGPSIIATTFVAYLICGTAVAGLSAWIGVTTGLELMVVVKRLFGCSGKKVLAGIILTICVPASALTGGYFAGWVLHSMSGLPHSVAVGICLYTFSLLAAGYGEEVLKISNYMALLLVPFLACASAQLEWSLPGAKVSLGAVDWPLVFALLGYNAGGMRPALVVEAGVHLAKKGYRAIGLAVLAKFIEGLITLLMAQIVLATGVQGPLALASAVDHVLGSAAGALFNVVLFCVLMNTMAPAMKVNACQISVLTGLAFWPALFLGATLIWLISFAGLRSILLTMSVTGLFMATFILYIAYFLHKNKQKKT